VESFERVGGEGFWFQAPSLPFDLIQDKKGNTGIIELLACLRRHLIQSEINLQKTKNAYITCSILNSNRCYLFQPTHWDFGRRCDLAQKWDHSYSWQSSREIALLVVNQDVTLKVLIHEFQHWKISKLLILLQSWMLKLKDWCLTEEEKASLSVCGWAKAYAATELAEKEGKIETIISVTRIRH